MGDRPFRYKECDSHQHCRLLFTWEKISVSLSHNISLIMVSFYRIHNFSVSFLMFTISTGEYRGDTGIQFRLVRGSRIGVLLRTGFAGVG